MRPVAWAASAAVLICGCVEREEEKVDETFIKQNLLAAEPTPKIRIDADFDGKVVYLGADVDKESLPRGDRVKVTHYWKVIQAPGSEWRAFTHLLGKVSEDWINIDDTKMRRQHGPGRWKAGEIVRDEQVIPLRGNWKSDEATLYVGLYRKGGQGEADRMPIMGGKDDGHHRVAVFTFPVISKTAQSGKPYAIRRAKGPITLDGKDDEADWRTAADTGPFKTASGGGDVTGASGARFLWDDRNLYAFVIVEDNDIANQYTKHDEPIWKEDAIELFIDADKNGRGYIELQVSPRNVTFDKWYPTVRPQGDETWSSDMKTAVTVNGTLDKRDDLDKGWKVEIAIPWAAVKGKDDKMAVTLPPKVGDSFKLNVVRVEKPKDRGVAASSWAPIGIEDFHAVDRLMPVTFADEKGETGAATAAGARDAGPAGAAAPRAKSDAAPK